MPTAFFQPTSCRTHDMGRGHPECPERMDAVADQLRASGLEALVLPMSAPAATREQMLRAHDADYLDGLEAVAAEVQASGRPRALDADTTFSAGTWAAVTEGAGAAVAAVDAVLDGRADNAFCATRPPGHHATRNQAMGFCFVNNVVVAARHALDVRGLQRVAIVDFDVHHGNGTEDIVAGDPRILMVGIFQHPLYPGSGVDPLGDNVFNIPVPPYSDGSKVRPLFERRLFPALDEFKPELIIVSAGFDAHREDPLAQLQLVEDDYAWITRELMALAERHCQGRIVSCLEGGYALGALGRSAAAHLRVLVGG